MRVPVQPGCVTSPFGPRRQIGPHSPAAMHAGVDLRAPAGGPVIAIAAGEVLAVQRRGAAGLAVTIRHAGLIALYGHLGSVSPALAAGSRRVAAGERLGVVGRTGVTYGTHLYLELREAGVAIDPAPLLAVKPCD